MFEQLELISFEDFCKGIAPLWKQEPNEIPIWNNPYGIVQYPESQWSTDIIYFPARYVVDGMAVGYISIYNLSDCHIRPRGIYIAPAFRGRGLGHRMQRAAWNLFPKSFYRAFIWSREENLDNFIMHSQMNEVPNVGPVWSDFSQLNMYFLYHDRGYPPNDKDIENNKKFISKFRNKYSLGGTNNLNVEWTNEQWDNYFKQHHGNYPALNINLDFEE